MVTTPSNKLSAASQVTTTAYTTASQTPAANSLQLLTVYSFGSGATPAAPTIAGNGLTWVQVASIVVDATVGKYQRITWFRALGAAPSAGALTITHGTNCVACAWVLDQFVGVDTSGTNGSGAVVQALTGSGTSTSASQTMAAFSDPDNVLYGSVGHGVQEAVTPASGFSELADLLNGKSTDPGAIETQWGYAFEDINFGWTTSSHYAYVAIEIASTPGQGYAPGSPTDFPKVFLELDLALQSAATRNWVDLSPRVISGNYKQARSFELDKTEAGDAKFVCRNNDRALDPEYTAGPYYGNLDSDRFVRCRVLWKGRWKNEWMGYLQDIVQTRDGFNDQRAEINCKNGFEPLSQETLSPTQFVLITSTGVTNGDLKYVGRGASSGGSGNSGYFQGSKLFGGFGTLLGNYAGGGSGITIAYVAGGSNPPITSANVTVDEANNAIAVQLQQATGQAQNIMNAINSHPIASRLVAVSLAPGSNGSGFVGPMGATPLAGGYPQEKSGARINRCLDTISPPWPVADRIIDVGTETIQNISFEKKDKIAALTHIQDVAATEIGVVFMDGRNRVVFHARTHRTGAAVFATLSDNPGGGEYPYVAIVPRYDNTKVWNQWTVTQNAPGSGQAIEVTVNDATSQLRHRIRNQSIQVICAAGAAVTTIANLLLGRYKNQVARYETITMMPTAQDNGFDVAFDIDVSTLLTIKRNPVAGPGVSSPTVTGNHFCEGKDISFNEENVWTFVFPITPAAFS